MNLLSLTSDSPSELNSSLWTATLHQRVINRLPGHRYDVISVRQFLDDTSYVRRAMANADVITVQRVAVQETLNQFENWKARNKTVLISLDDHYAKIERDNQAFSFWGKGEVEVSLAPNISYYKKLDTHPIAMLKEILRKGTGGTSPGKKMVEYWKEFGNMWYLPNYIDSERYLSVPQVKRNDGRILIGYGGSMSHVPSFMESGINEALARIVAKRKNVYVLVCGDKRVWDNLPVADSRKMHQSYVKHHIWPKVLQGFDIGLAPLAREYDHFRSAIKAEEYSVMGIPFVATRSVVYDDFEKNGVGVYIPNGDFDGISLQDRIDAWENALLDMVDNLVEWRVRAKKWLGYGMEWDVTRNANNIISLYERIMAV